MSFNFAALNDLDDDYSSEEEMEIKQEEEEEEEEQQAKKQLKSKHQQLAEIFEEEDLEANLAEAERVDDEDFVAISKKTNKSTKKHNRGKQEHVAVEANEQEQDNSIDFAFQIILPFKLSKSKNEKVVPHTIMTHFKKYLKKQGRDKLLSKYNDNVTDIYPGFFNVLLGKIGLSKEFVLKHEYLSKRIENQEKTKQLKVNDFTNKILVKVGAKPEYIIKTKELLTREQLLRYKMVPQALQEHNNTQAKLAEKKLRKQNEEEQEGEKVEGEKVEEPKETIEEEAEEQKGEAEEAEKPALKHTYRKSLRGKWILKCEVSDNYEDIVRAAVDSMLAEFGLGSYASLLNENNQLKDNDVVMKPLEIVPMNELAMTIAKYDRSPGYIGMHKNLLRIEKNSSSNEELPNHINCHSIFLTHYGGEKHYDTIGGIDSRGYMLEPKEGSPTVKTRNIVFNFTSPPRDETPVSQPEPEPFVPSKAAKKKKKKNKKKN